MEPIARILVVRCSKEFDVSVRELIAYALIAAIVVAVTAGYTWWKREQRRRYPWKFRGR